MKDVGDLPDDVGVRIERESGEIRFRYVVRKKFGGWRVALRNDRAAGYIYIAPGSQLDGPCDKAYVVSSSAAAQGWGPLLYVIAMEWATKHGNGLTPDRTTVSADAKRVWEHFAKRSDVRAFQLDDPKNTLTPIDRDNCNQDVAGDAWQKSPLSKRYLKSPPKTINALRAAGRLVE
jgi:hypothetical protein